MAFAAFRANPLRRSGAFAALGIAALVVGCLDPIGPKHDTLTVELDSSDGSQVRLITSNDFSRALDADQQEVFLLRDADTVWVDVPFEQDYDLNETGRFYVRAAELTNPEATVTMRVRLDGEVTFQRVDSPLTGTGLQFFYTTN